MVPDHGTKYDENPFSHRGGWREDDEVDWSAIFPNFTIGERGVIIAVYDTITTA